jgi:hypothetical protein
MMPESGGFVELSSQMTPPSVELPPDIPEAVAALATALALPAADQRAALAAVARSWPAFVGGWAHLAAAARGSGEEVEAYAFARTAYHRALDRLRGNGWRGMGLVPWAHEPNQTTLLAFYELMRAAESIDETSEVERLRQLLLDSDPSDPLQVASTS